MAFQLSPGVLVVEKDLTSIIPAVASSSGAFAGTFAWGPVLNPTQITSENQLVSRFGKPYDGNASSFFTAANFLSYTNNLQVVRVDTQGARNAVASTSGSVSTVSAGFGATGVAGFGYSSAPTVTFSAPQTTGGKQATATANIANGVITAVTVGASGVNYTSPPTITITGDGSGATATATLSGTGVNSIKITNGGSGYTTATFAFSGGGGSGAAAGTTTIQNGVVTSITVDEPGSGYSSAPTVTVAAASAGATGVASVSSDTVTSTNHGYINGDKVTYSAGIGGGIGGLTNGDYFVVSATTNTFKLSSSFNGSAIAITAGSGDETFTKVTSSCSAYASRVVAGIKINNEDTYLTSYASGQGVVGPWAAKYPGALGNSLKVSIADASNYTGWAYATEFDGAPDTTTYASSVNGSGDELHIIIVDEDGLWTGTQGAVLEKFAFVSKASDARRSDGTNNYYKDVINTQSKYIWWMDHPDSAVVGVPLNWGTTAANSSYDDVYTQNWSLSGGVDDLNATDGQLIDGFTLFANAEIYDISLIPTGKVSPTVAKAIIENVAEVRRDCVVFVSPVTPAGDVIQGVDAVEDTIAFRTSAAFNANSSYAVLDSGFKYQYDRYNDVYRWIPLNGDIAGLCARTDYTNDPWWSPGGLNRGQVKNVVKLSVNPNQAQRDELYKNGINPVVSFPGQGTVLFGDKTLLSKPSAFDRINVRRLFIVLEKAIATAAKYQLFEFNDNFTRAQFRAMVEPFLRDVQGRRGIIDFRVKCDETNNTGEVIDRNEFIADIFIKPARAINFITLNFIAARTGISFDEIGG